MKRLLLLLIVLGAAGGGGWYWWKNRASEAPQYRTGKVEKGDVLVAVTATATVQPVNQVQVGTQVSGTIKSLGADWNSVVTKETVLAQIDPAPFEARVQQDTANLKRSRADVERVQAGLTRAEAELKRAQELRKEGLNSPSELDVAVAERDGLKAQMKVAEASVEQSEATLRVSEVNKDYTTIKSPIDGIVISRNVDVGSTVAASLSSPTLYVIAESLKKVLLQASVAEADIAKIFQGQTATFTVDAWRERRFKGTVTQIRLQPTTVQNVVTYTVMLAADNPDEKLLPGMTASVTFEVERAKDVLKVPNSALRFTPADVAAAPEPAAGGKRGEGRKESKTGRIWIQGASGPVAVEIETGPTDGSFTVVTKGELQEGQEILIGLATATKDSGMNNPFAPSGGGRGGGGGGGGRGR